jgi:chemotaxis regulatin CheY-phosphate phosphatase CheZ
MDNNRNSANEDDNEVGMIKDFIAHVRGIVPMLEHVKDSIAESSGRIPKASLQLSEVTTATESATVEILNVLEAMTTSIGQGETELKAVRTFVEHNNGTSESVQALQSIAAVEKILSETKDNSMNIAIALQVQDITSQQIAGVSHTIESIRTQLAKALQRFDDPKGADGGVGNAETESSPGLAPATHFDGEAQFTKSPDRQDVADEIVKQWAQGTSR